MSDVADLIDALSGFAWPLLIIAIILVFREPLRNFISGASEANVKAGVFEASLKRTAEAAASIAHAEATRATAGADAGAGEVGEPQQTASAVAQAVAKLPDEQTEQAQPKLLWVDDRPQNNVLERQAFEQLGIAVELALSTAEALDALQTGDFDLVITDMGRPEGARAGYDLLEEMQRIGVDAPVIIYSIGGSSEEHVAEAKARGAYASTSGPTQLLRHVTAALAVRSDNQGSKSRRWPRLQFK